jgi:hypothetical protein
MILDSASVGAVDHPVSGVDDVVTVLPDVGSACVESAAWRLTTVLAQRWH